MVPFAVKKIYAKRIIPFISKAGLKTTEVPVDYRKRIGVSKVSGTIKGVIGAGYKILWTIWRYR